VPDTFAISSDFANTIQPALQKKVLPKIREELRFAQLAREGRIDRGSDRLRFFKTTDVAESTAVLPDEISQPTIEALPLFTTVDITPTEIGRVWGISRRAKNLSLYDLVDIARDTIGYDASRRIDTIVRDVLLTGGTVMYAGAATSRITVGAGDTLKMNDARRWLVRLDSMNLPSDGLVAITHPFVVGDLMADTAAPGGWQTVNVYGGSGQGILNGELGRAYGTRFVTTTRSKAYAGAGAAGATVYVTFVGVSPRVIGSATVTDLEFKYNAQSDKSDLLNRKTLLGYYMDYGAGLIESTQYIRFESGATSV